MATKNIPDKRRKSANSSKRRVAAQSTLAVIDDFKAPEVRPGTIGATREDQQRNYAHVRECAERIAQKLEAEDTPKLVKKILERYLSDLGAQYMRYPRVVRVAYEEICLAVSRPPFPLHVVVSDDYVGHLEELLNRDPQRSLAEARRIQGHGFLKDA
jgi:hypothetical protein